MKRTLFFAALSGCLAFAQEPANTFHFEMPAGLSFAQNRVAQVQGAPYSATMVSENIQTLSDGNRIVQKTTGSVARDSMGRTRQDTLLPSIGNMSAANAPHLVTINDPVAKVNYTLNLDEKTAHKGVMGAPGEMIRTMTMAAGSAAAGGPGDVRMKVSGTVPDSILLEKLAAEAKSQYQSHSEDLGMQVMEGISVVGVRRTRTIAAGEIGNDRAIESYTEIWTSPELKTIVYSKRSDPRTGDQIFRLTNIVRTEPDAALFAVPADFKVLEPGEPEMKVFYRTKE